MNSTCSSFSRHSTAFGYLSLKLAMNSPYAFSAASFVSAWYMSCSIALAFDCTPLGSLSSTFAVLCTLCRYRHKVHKIVNVLDRIPTKKQIEAKMMVAAIPYCVTREEAEKGKSKFELWCKSNGLDKAAEILNADWQRMMTFYSFPKEHWQHIRTTNVVESPFAAMRLRTDAAKRFKKVENATAMIWKMMLVAEKRFRKLNAPELLQEVYRGVEFVDGVAIGKKKEAAA